VFTARYAVRPYIKQTRFVFKRLISRNGGFLDGFTCNATVCELVADFCCLLWNPKVHVRVHNSLPLPLC